MNRIIKFRGKCSRSNEWVYGNLIDGVGSKSGNLYILPNKINLAYVKHCDPLDGVKVIPETIGQLTGLKDMNGADIYEGDIVCNHNYQTWEWRGVVKYSDGIFGAEWLANVKSRSMVGLWDQRHNLRKLDDGITDRLIVVGNIFDNADLLIEPNDNH